MIDPRNFVFLLSGDASGIEDASKQAQKAIEETKDDTVALSAAQKRAGASSDNLAVSLVKVGAAHLPCRRWRAMRSTRPAR